MATTAQLDPCPVCGNPLPPGTHGQTRTTCSDVCRQRAFRKRRDALAVMHRETLTEALRAAQSGADSAALAALLSAALRAS